MGLRGSLKRTGAWSAAEKSLVAVQRERLARREQAATNEDALLTHLLEQAEAIQAVARED